MKKLFVPSRKGILTVTILCCLLIFCQGFIMIRNASGQTDGVYYFTLERAIQWALSSDLGLQSAQEDIKAAMARKNARGTDFFPTFNLTYQYVRNDDKQTVTELGTIRPRNEYTIIGKFTQPLFEGFSILNRYKISDLSLQVSAASEQVYRQDVIYSAMDAYFSLLKSRKLWEIAQETVSEIEAQRKDAKNFYEVGITPLNDLLQVEVELANAKQDLVASRNNLQTDEANFNKVLRRPINAPVYLEDILYFTPFDYDIEYCFGQAEIHRQELDIADLELQIAKKEFDISKKGFFPSISLEGRYVQQGTEWDARGGLGVLGDSSFWNITAVATWNFFEWGRTYYGAEEQIYRVAQTRLERFQLLDDIRLEVKESYLRMRQAETNIQTIEVAIAQAEENFRINRERYQEQIATATDVLIAQTLLSRTRTNYFNAVYDYEIAKAELFRAMGVLNMVN